VSGRHAAQVDALQDVVGRTRPVPAGDRLLPVLPALESLLPWRGLRRGATVTVGGTAATSLALALAVAASRAGSWCAAAGLPSLGLVAAAEVGIDLARFPMVALPRDGREWAAAVAAVVDSLDLVLVHPPGRVHAADARRLAARARERGSVLVGGGGPWAGADVRLAVQSSRWEGLGHGHGRLRARRVEVVAAGRGAAARPRGAALWLPGADGAVHRARGPVTASARLPVAAPAPVCTAHRRRPGGRRSEVAVAG
jgi:hypothetical protein